MEQTGRKEDVPDTQKGEDLEEPPRKRFTDDTQSNSGPDNVHREGKQAEKYRSAFYHESMTVDPWKNLKPISFQEADCIRRSRFPPRQ
ncbi:DgyrCDS6484 [Dimorphilus gyrociliatus]|uniref:DgyrCDS6484 n=1 Tax=Dimorphilus gyrociliatus TaxID=2664684 RepID=A0A7I8VN75_9ANNE|nr:DgyrCDS6484 [Dimorphilus gyrociliatus]